MLQIPRALPIFPFLIWIHDLKPRVTPIDGLKAWTLFNSCIMTFAVVADGMLLPISDLHFSPKGGQSFRKPVA